MKKYAALLSCLVTACALLASCEEQTTEGTGSISFSGNSALTLPPGFPPGTVVAGATIYLPAEATPPLIHYANCFAGVKNPLDFGIGSSAGATKDYRGYAILPVNINLGTKILGAYRIRVEVNPAVAEIDLANIFGSNSLLSSGDCRLRGCPTGCLNYPAYYPADEFDPAPGFEKSPEVTGDADGVTVESADTTGFANPTTGKVNLCNIRINIVRPLPSGGSPVTFTVDLLDDSAALPITPNPLPGLIIEDFQVQ
jgi:predicted small secreted protein